jgi:diguanylate cyclase (GGDEF)-like protein/PAS domain S-box-containing protein
MLSQANIINDRLNKVVRILLVEDTLDHAELISALLNRQDQSLEVLVASNVAETLEHHANFSPDLIITDYRLGRESCFDVLHALKARNIATPVIIFTGQGDERVAAEAIGEGAYDYLIKDQVFTQTSNLVKSIYSALHRYHLQQALQESEELYRTLVENIQAGVFIIRNKALIFSNPAFISIVGVAEERILGKPFKELFILTDRPAIEETIEKVETGNGSEKGRFILIGPEKRPQIFADLTFSRVIYAGETAVIGTAKDISAQIAAENDLKETLEEKERLSITDELTGLYNRRHSLATLENELTRSKRYNQELSLIMFDLDDFKSINDNYGHIAGDSALAAIADVLQKELRDSDIASRYGGDEFLVILPHTGLQQASNIAERIRNRLLEKRVIGPDGELLQLTTSLGVTSMVSTDQVVEDMISRADKGLMMAKKAGKNQVAEFEA